MVPWQPIAVISELTALVVALLTVQPLRESVFRIDVRWLIAFHFTRFVGIYFLVLFARHELPYAFAVWGGSGDILVAAIALIVIFFVRFRPGFIAWNVLGLVDIVAVVSTAARSEMSVPGSMHQLNRFPLILLPTFVVPLVMLTHGIMLVRAFEQTQWSRDSSSTLE
jgi:hypothetical protein